MQDQELVDRLVHAVEEQDPAFVWYWLQEMRGRGMVGEGVKTENGVATKHTWKHISALVAAVSQSETRTSRLVLEMLLYNIPASGRGDALSAAVQAEKQRAVRTMARWETGGKEEAKEAAHLAIEDSDEAGKWIDANGFFHPHPERTTGAGPLPLPVSDPSSLPPPSIHCTAASAAAERPPSPPLQPSTAPAAVSSSLPSFHLAPSAVQPAFSLGAQSSVRCHLGGFFPETTEEQIDKILVWAGISQAQLSTVTRGSSKCAYFTVPCCAEYVRVSKLLHDSFFHGRKLLFERNFHSYRLSTAPTVLIRNLPYARGERLVRDLSRMARCGAYDSQMYEAGDGFHGIGVFRVPCEDSARDAVGFFDGQLVYGEAVSASWYPAGWKSGDPLPQQKFEPGDPNALVHSAEATQQAVAEANGQQQPSQAMSAAMEATLQEEEKAPAEEEGMEEGAEGVVGEESVGGVVASGKEEEEEDLDGVPLSPSAFLPSDEPVQQNHPVSPAAVLDLTTSPSPPPFSVEPSHCAPPGASAPFPPASQPSSSSALLSSHKRRSPSFSRSPSPLSHYQQRRTSVSTSYPYPSPDPSNPRRSSTVEDDRYGSVSGGGGGGRVRDDRWYGGEGAVRVPFPDLSRTDGGYSGGGGGGRRRGGRWRW
ncbi:hypothetical protein JCM10213_006013 [Rhodosporidiobolus nylandii]